ncbi:hypothetical protein EGT07_32220, partial [Herbaspirillum sp. HC18]
KDVTQALTAVEMQSPDPAGLAEHWGRIVGVAPSDQAELKLPNAIFRFVTGASEIMSALEFRVIDATQVLDAARAKGRAVVGNEFLLGGVTFRVI